MSTDCKVDTLATTLWHQGKNVGVRRSLVLKQPRSRTGDEWNMTDCTCYQDI